MVDDSKSMAGVSHLALTSLATLSGALNRLEVGELAVTSFSNHLELLHSFGTPFDDEAGARVVETLSFRGEGSGLASALQGVMEVFERAREGNVGSRITGTVVQLCFVVSDARLDSDNRTTLRHVIREMAEQHVLVVLLIIDKGASSSEGVGGDGTSVSMKDQQQWSGKGLQDQDSIFNTKTVEFTSAGIVTKAYLDDFPFPYYVAVRHPEALPGLLSDALRQWFELVKAQLDR